MILVLVFKVGLKVYNINVKAQKIDSSIFKTFEMALASFLVENKHK